jgi:hypothetical protein
MTPGRTCSQDHRKADPCGGLSVRLSTRPLFPPSSALQEWRQDQRRAQFRRAGQERWTGRPDAWDSRARARMGVGRHGREGAGHTAGRATVPRLQRASSSGHRGQSISPPCMPRVRAGRARFKCSLRRAGPRPLQVQLAAGRAASGPLPGSLQRSSRTPDFAATANTTWIGAGRCKCARAA